MNKLLSLIKIDLIHSYSINKLSKKHNKNRKLGSLIATLLLGAFLICAIFIFMFSMGIISSQVNHLDFILVFGYTIGSFLVLTTTISKANGLLFESKDFELLYSMPISSKIIVMSKMISLLILNYISFAIIFIPCIIVYGILSSASILFYILGFISVIIGPLLIVTICSFLSYLLGLLLKKFKSKSIIMSMFSLFFFIIVMVLYMSFVNKMEYTGDPNLELEYFENYFSSMKDNFITYYPISKLLSSGLTGNYLNFLYYFLIMIIPFTILVLFISKNFLKANMRSKLAYTNKKYKLKEQKQNSKIVSLLKRDFKRFFSSSTQVLNIGIGPIISTIILVVMIINFNDKEDILTNDFLSEFLPLMLLLSIGFTYGIMPSTSSSISLEGKNFWIIKSAPIKTTDIFISKILFYLIICIPFVIINTTIMSILLHYSLLKIILCLVIQLLLVLVYSVEGLWINILTPKFDWDNEVKAIKQGTGPLLSMLFGILLGLIMYVTPFFAISFEFNGLIVLMCNTIIVLIIMCIILFTNGKNRYEKIQA